MSRTQKGSKGPGWEPWSNRHEKAEQKADYREPESHEREYDVCPGCRLCECVKCGGVIAYKGDDPVPRCIQCGHVEESDERV